MVTRGKNINLFLIDGEASGRIKCTMANWVGIAYKIPRTELERCQERDDLKQSGVYFLFGVSEKTGKDIDNNFVDCVIQLPDNLFYGTSIATCIMVLKKSKQENNTLFIDASKEYVKVTNSNKLTVSNIAHIIDIYKERADKDYLAKVVPNADIETQDYNLSVSTYVEQEDTREKIDIAVLNAEIKQIVAREQVLRDEIDKIIAEIEVDGDAIN